MTKDNQNLDFGSAIEAARAIQRGEITSLELTKRILERIEKYNHQCSGHYP